MARYVVLSSWTEQGVGNAKDTFQRLEAARRGGQALGTRIVDFYWLMGPYDLLAIVEAPDDETMTRFSLAVGMQGSARTMTMRAFTEAEMHAVVQGLP